MWSEVRAKSHSRGGNRSSGSNSFVQSTGAIERATDRGAQAGQVEGEVTNRAIQELSRRHECWGIGGHWFCMC